MASFCSSVQRPVKIGGLQKWRAPLVVNHRFREYSPPHPQKKKKRPRETQGNKAVPQFWSFTHMWNGASVPASSLPRHVATRLGTATVTRLVRRAAEEAG